MPTESKALNLNTVFLTVLLGLNTWMINKVSTLGEQMSAQIAHEAATAREILELRTRLAAVESSNLSNQLEIARLKQRQ